MRSPNVARSSGAQRSGKWSPHRRVSTPPISCRGSCTKAQGLFLFFFFLQRSKSGSRTADPSSRRCGKAARSPQSSTLEPALPHHVPPRRSRRQHPGTSARRSGWRAAARVAEAAARAAPAPARAAPPRLFWETTRGTTRLRAPLHTCRPPLHFCILRRLRRRTTTTIIITTQAGAPR